MTTEVQDRRLMFVEVIDELVRVDSHVRHEAKSLLAALYTSDVPRTCRLRLWLERVLDLADRVVERLRRNGRCRAVRHAGHRIVRFRCV